jgi:DNA-binding CsgD family transcriptional regulator
MRKSSEASSHLVLVKARSKSLPAADLSAAESVPPPVPSSAALVQELVIDGRRYRLVPAEIGDTGVPPAEQQPRPKPALAEILTGRELQIAALVAEGRVNKQIAAELQISEWTVSTHLRRIFAKLGVDTRAAMVSRCFEALRLQGRE